MSNAFKIKNINNWSNSKFIITLIILFISCILLFIFGFIYSLTNHSQYHIKNLAIKQDDVCLDMSWSDEKAKGYMIILFVNNHFRHSKIYSSETNSFKHEIKKLGEKYTCIIFAKNEHGGLSSATIKKVQTKKLKQEIQVNPIIQGIKEDTINIDAKARSRLKYKSCDTNIATINSEGIINFKNKGSTDIELYAVEDNQFLSTSKKINIVVYPNILDTPKPNITYNDNNVMVSWESIKYAQEYILTKYNPYSKKYDPINTLQETTINLPRIGSKYKLIARCKLNNKEIKSKEADIKIKSIMSTAKTYNSSHNIKKLDHSSLNLITKVSGYKGASVPQSMSLVKDNYVISFSSTGDKKGALVEYDTSGNIIKKEQVSGIGHANGSTYNPNTDRIYTVKTHGRTAKTWTKVCTTFNSNLTDKKTFILPKNTSGIAYDESMGKYFLSKGNELYVTDTKFKVEKFLWKKIRYHHAQDIGAYDGIFYVCTWTGGNTSYIDLYRSSDGEYLGSYYLPIGEVESCFIEINDSKKYLVILMNNDTKYGDCILKTKDPINY